MSSDSDLFLDDDVELCPRKIFQFVSYMLDRGEEGRRMDEWVEDGYKRFITEHDEFSSGNKYMTKHYGKPAVQQLFILLRECLLTHRWQDVLHTLQALVQAPKQADAYITKAAFEAFQNSPMESDHLLSQLVSVLKKIRFADTYEVLVEYVLYLMSQGKTDELKEEIKQAPGTRQMGQNQAGTCRRSKHFRLLYLAYQGLMWYTEWLNAGRLLSENPTEGSQTEANFYRESAMKTYATKAASFLSEVQEEAGVWDIFIFCHIELLEFLGEGEKGSTLLTNYVEKNKDNPAALKKLYKYYKIRSDDTQAYKALLKLCNLVPSAEEVLELYDIDKALGADSGAVVELLFQHLDYHCRKDSLPAWQCLYKSLEEESRRKTFEAVSTINRCWEDRKDWWPVYHFGLDNKYDDSSLQRCKACVAVLLMGRNDFTRAIQNNIQNSSFTSSIDRALEMHRDLFNQTSDVQS